jgi:formylglycine-generating enzyme required for sulfatase activity
MGVAGALNDNADITAPVKSYQPNAWGLYNMAGNVNEWVGDTYRPNSHQDADEFRPFRGGVYMRPKFQDDGTVEERDSTGHIPYTRVTNAELDATHRYSSRTSDVINFKDGGKADDTTMPGSSSNYYGSYKFGETSLVNDSSKVYKGGSWADRAYWLSPGTRRYVQGNTASNTIGFRCVVDRLGSPSGNNEPAGNHFGTQKKHKR